MERLNTEISLISAKLDDVQSEQVENTRAIMKVQKNAERYLAKRQNLASRKQACELAIRDLGVLPEDAFTKYTGERLDKVS